MDDKDVLISKIRDKLEKMGNSQAELEQELLSIEMRLDKYIYESDVLKEKLRAEGMN